MEMLIFENVEDLMATTEVVSGMSTTELAAFENSNGYISLGRKADQVYGEIDFESFLTQQELISYVKTKSKYVTLLEDNGELMTEPILSGNVYRRLANHDGLFAIKDTVYRVLKEGFVSTAKDNIAALAAFDSKDPSLAEQDPKLTFAPFFSNPDTRRIDVNGPTVVARQDVTVGRDRVVMKIECVGSSFSGVTTYNVNACGSAQKKVLGSWHATSRTISFDYYIHFTSPVAGGFNHRESGSESAYRVERVLYGGVSRPNITFHAFDCWATTPSVDFQKARIVH